MAHVLFVVQEDPLITIGQNTFIADALRWAGAESVILSKQEWPRIGMEEVVRVQPDWIVLSGEHMLEEGITPKEFLTRPAWKDLRAVELGRVVTANDDITRPSPELVDAIEDLAHKLHPDAFAAPDNASAPAPAPGAPR
jgi:iron complex transport system substrate-binding protein